MHMDLDELTMLLRAESIFDYKELELAIVEQSGELSVLKKPAYQEVTQQDLHIKGKSKGLAIEVIVDGQIIYENLRVMGLDGKWLVKQLRRRNIANASLVCLATVNKQKTLQIDLFDDNIPGMIDMSEEDTPKMSLDGIQTRPKDTPSNNLP